jgi:hypothetical protein
MNFASFLKFNLAALAQISHRHSHFIAGKYFIILTLCLLMVLACNEQKKYDSKKDYFALASHLLDQGKDSLAFIEYTKNKEFIGFCSDYDKVCFAQLVQDFDNNDDAIKILNTLNYKDENVNYLRIAHSSIFEKLQSTDGWKNFIAKFYNHYPKCYHDMGYNAKLCRLLDTIHLNDQLIRAKYDPNHQELTINKLREIDAYNLPIIDSLLNTGADTLLPKHCYLTFFIIIQHSNIELMEKYLPKFKSYADEGKILKSVLVMMVDRISVNKFGYQLYGTQFDFDEKGNYILTKVDSPEKLNERRKEIGLSPLKQH